MSSIFSVVSKKRGHVIEALQVGRSPMYTVNAFLPVNESFGTYLNCNNVKFTFNPA